MLRFWGVCLIGMIRIVGLGGMRRSWTVGVAFGEGVCFSLLISRWKFVLRSSRYWIKDVYKSA